MKHLINTIKINAILLIVMLPTSNILSQVDWTSYHLLANYPLTKNTIDITGNYDPITTKNINFDNNAAYSNGIYLGSFTDGCLIATPPVTAIDLVDFGFSIEIQFDTIYNTQMPIIVAGQNNRYLEVFLDMWQGDVKLFLNKNYGEFTIKHDSLLVPYQWYKIDVLHKSDKTTLYLNDQLIGEHTGTLEFYDQEESASTKILSNTNAGDGRAFKGLWRNLKIYSKLTSALVEPILSNIITYPNPAINFLNVNLTALFDIRSYHIFDSNGRIILSKELNTTSHNLEIDITDIYSGTYQLILNKELSNKKNISFIKL